MNIYVINGQYKDENDKAKRKHLHVVALSFEKALEMVRDRHPELDVTGVSRQNDIWGHPVILP